MTPKNIIEAFRGFAVVTLKDPASTNSNTTATLFCPRRSQCQGGRHNSMATIESQRNMSTLEKQCDHNYAVKLIIRNVGYDEDESEELSYILHARNRRLRK